MALLDEVISDALKAVDWMSAARDGTNTAESLAPLLIKVALDGYAAATGGGSIMQVVHDVEALLPAAESAFKANNAETAPAPTAVSAEPAA